MLRLRELTKLAKSLVAVSCVITFTSLTGCGGGGGGGDESASKSAGIQENISSTNSFTAETASAVTTSLSKPQNRQEAARFLTQATFGPTASDIDHLMSVGYNAWFTEQVAARPLRGYQSHWDARNLAIKSATPNAQAGVDEINQAFWTNALASSDQLRQRVALALSEIFVISTANGCAENHLSGAANYFDMLADKAFGSYKDLLKAVTLHPVMGCYLSHLRNQKEAVDRFGNPTGRIPDENYAREVMQLFSIGLYQLNADGTQKLDGAGKPIPTYSSVDISGLANVFTGWSWDCPDWPSDYCFSQGVRQSDKTGNANRWAVPMRAYAQFHSTKEKRFLGTVIPAQTTPDPQRSLDTAMDTLAKHPNVGPFIGRQLIQRLVTSNPSANYVRRVSTAFTQSNGNLQAMVIAVLTDPEARSTAGLSDPTFGKVREPLLRLTAFFRAYGVQSITGNFMIWNTNDQVSSIGQNAYQAPSVFNFFRPGYVLPGSESAASGLVSPEMQLVNETSLAGYISFMRPVIVYGYGKRVADSKGVLNYDVTLEYHRNSGSASFALAEFPDRLVEDINQKLMYGTMSSSLKAEIIAAVTSIDTRAKKNPNQLQLIDTYTRRLYSALLLTMASPEFLIQK